MGRPRKYENFDIYAPQRAYLKTEKGKEAVKRYNASESAKAIKREWKRRHDGTIVDKRQWFLDTYGEIEAALNLLDQQEQLVMTRLYGLDGSKPMIQKAIAEELSVTRQRIAQIKKKALETLND